MILKMTMPRMELWRIDGPFSNVLHMHENKFQITVPMYGTCRFTQENRTYKLANGCGLVQPPRERHVFEIGEQSGVLIFKVKQEDLIACTRHSALELDLKQQFDRPFLAGKLRQWMDSLLAYDHENRLAQEEIESQVLSYLCDALTGSHSNAAGTAKEITSPVTIGADPFMAQALDYIHAHFADSITIADLAAIAMQSRFHFIRTFKTAFGVTPYQYVLQLRIDEAKRLLSHSDRSITDIGMGLGFSSGSAFYRAFIKSVGITPEQFRNGNI